MKDRLKIAVIAGGIVISFGTGFISGMQYQTYQIQKAFTQAFTTTPGKINSEEATPTPKPQKKIEVAFGQEAILATETITVTKAEEIQILSPKYSNPKVAKDGTKFVLIYADITNTTKGDFTFSPDNLLRLVDNKKREFKLYDTYVGELGNAQGLEYTALAPSIKQSGFLVYEVPNDATEYTLQTTKEGTNDLYILKLK